MSDATAREFGELLEPILYRIERLARQVAWAHVEPDDLVSVACADALRSFAGFQRGTNFGGWMATVVRRVAWRMNQAAAKVASKQTHLEEIVIVATSDEQEVTASRFLEQLPDEMRSALEELRPLQRKVMMLRLARGLKLREIAVVLGIPIGTVVSNLTRARRSLRERLYSTAKDVGFVGPRAEARRAG